jgi:hypothetical protein
MDIDQEQGIDTRYERDQGFNPPKWITDQLTQEALQRLERDDDDINDYLEGFCFMFEWGWIQGAGHIIGSTKRLKEIDLWLDSRSRNTWMNELCEGLSRNRTIERLDIHSDLDDEDTMDCIISLTPFLVHNDKLRCLSVPKISSRELDSLLKLLSKCKTGLEFIQIEFRMSDEQLAMFFNSLHELHNNVLEICLDTARVGMIGAMALANLLTKPACKIRLLEFCAEVSCGSVGKIVGDAMIRNCSVKFLHLSGSTSVIFLSKILAHPMCSLEHMWLVGAGLNDEDIISLGDALAINRSLKHLYIDGDPITSEGWRKFSTCLTSDSPLETLDLENTGIDVEGTMAILTALAMTRNSSLRDLRIGNESNSRVQEALSVVLCDKSSINNTFFSSHALHTIDNHSRLDCEQYLQMNRNKNKGEVARQKIIRNHFSGANMDINVKMFAHLPIAVLPNVVEWIGRDNLGYSLMFRFVQSFPRLVVHLPETGVKRRKLVL